MRALSADTHPAAERVQIELLRGAGARARFRCMCSLSQTTLELSRRALRRVGRFGSEEEIGLAFVERNYGRDLARRVRRYLAERQS